MRTSTQAKLKWIQSTIRQMELAGYEPTEVLTVAFDRYIKNELTFYELCSVIRDEGE